MKYKVLYDNGNLIILDGSNVSPGQSLGEILGFEKGFRAEAIYVKDKDVFYPLIYKSPQPLIEFCEQHGIDMHRTGQKEVKGLPAHMFTTSKDQFLFELKFGK